MHVHSIEDQEREKLVAWLSVPEVSRTQNAAREKRMKGSGAWFLESSTFLNWKNEDGSVIWLSGGRESCLSLRTYSINDICGCAAGWGKTVLR